MNCFKCAACLNVLSLNERVKWLNKWKKLYKKREQKVHIEISDDESKQHDQYCEVCQSKLEYAPKGNAQLRKLLKMWQQNKFNPRALLNEQGWEETKLSKKDIK